MALERHYVGAYVGNAGGGKSVSLAALIIWQLLSGRTVWSNMPVKVSPAILNRKDFYGIKISEKQTDDLDMNLLYLLDTSLVKGTIAMDEAGYFADSRQSGSIKNRLINACIRQLRHRSLNFFYTAFDFHRVDMRLRDETDYLCECEDLAYKPWGRENNAPNGVAILQRYFDLSGKMTGKRVNPDGGDRVPYRVRRLHARVYWESYDTANIISLEEAFSGVELDLRKSRISNRDSWNEETEAAILDTLVELKQLGYDRMPSRALWAHLNGRGIDGVPSVLGKYIPTSIKRGHSRREGEYYDLSGLELGVVGGRSDSP